MSIHPVGGVTFRELTIPELQPRAIPDNRLIVSFADGGAVHMAQGPVHRPIRYASDQEGPPTGTTTNATTAPTPSSDPTPTTTPRRSESTDGDGGSSSGWESSMAGALPLAGIAMAADGPLPIGDVVALGIVAVAGVVAISQVSSDSTPLEGTTSGTTTPPASGREAAGEVGEPDSVSEIAGAAAEFDVEELAQLAYQHAGEGDLEDRPGFDEILDALDNGEGTRIRKDAVRFEKDSVVVIINESLPPRSTAFYS